MRTLAALFPRRLLALSLLLTLLAGCASSKIDWASRVGHYTFDQAVGEFGPPEKSAKLDDGSTVADWLLRKGTTTTFANYPYGGYRRAYYDPGLVAINSTSPDYFLRLTFGADGQLKTWKKFAR